jgi:hypothetical protein
MAISDNPLLKGLSGSIDRITVKQYGNQTVICKKIGKRRKKASAAQQANEQAFYMASKVASSIYADPVQREEARLRLNVPHGSALYRAILKECRAKEED